MGDRNPRPRGRLVLFGAGMTGRGQVAQLAFEDGWDLTLIDCNAGLVDQLRQAGQYTVKLLGVSSRDLVVAGYTALHTSQVEAVSAAIQQADLVVTSVLEPNLPEVGKLLAKVLPDRFRNNPLPLNILAAENMNHSSADLRGYVRDRLAPEFLGILEQRAGFPNSMISRVVPIAQDPLVILTEDFSEWTADRTAVIGPPPELAGLEWVTNQTARLQRKLYIHNTGHVICGYLGWLAGYPVIHQAAQDPKIMSWIRLAISESGAAVSAEHGFPRAEVGVYEEHLLGRLVLTALPDDIRRVIRHPLRKLGKEERLVGPLLLCEKYGLPHRGLCYGVAAVLAGCQRPYDYREYDDQSERVRIALERKDPVAVLLELVGYEPGREAAGQISAFYEQLKLQ